MSSIKGIGTSVLRLESIRVSRDARDALVLEERHEKDIIYKLGTLPIIASVHQGLRSTSIKTSPTTSTKKRR